tara:strand:- start:301 stop:495 length:195 start_codon:yes stop_codon:yes gene_type:complete
MSVTTKETRKLRDEMADLQRKLDYSHGDNFEYLSMQIDVLIDEINSKEAKQTEVHNAKMGKAAK